MKTQIRHDTSSSSRLQTVEVAKPKLMRAIEFIGASRFLVSMAVLGTLSLLSLVDGLIYTAFRIPHLNLMHEIVTFTGVGGIVLGVFGALSVKERKNLDPLGTKKVVRPVIDLSNEELRYNKTLCAYVFIALGSVFYIILANGTVTFLESFVLSY